LLKKNGKRKWPTDSYGWNFLKTLKNTCSGIAVARFPIPIIVESVCTCTCR